MTLDRQDIEEIAREVARLILPALTGQQPPPAEPPVMHGSFRQRAQEAIARAEESRKRREKREGGRS